MESRIRRSKPPAFVGAFGTNCLRSNSSDHSRRLRKSEREYFFPVSVNCISYRSNMPRHTNTSSNQSRRQTGWIWAIIFLVNAVIVVDSWKHHNRIVKCCDASMRQAALKIDRHSDTGYELGMRRLILPLQAIDGLHWIMHAQCMLRDSKWRVRSTTGDNFPQGRAFTGATVFSGR